MSGHLEGHILILPGSLGGRGGTPSWGRQMRSPCISLFLRGLRFFLSQSGCLTPPPKESVINSSQVQVRKVRALDPLKKKAGLGGKRWGALTWLHLLLLPEVERAQTNPNLTGGAAGHPPPPKSRRSASSPPLLWLTASLDRACLLTHTEPWAWPGQGPWKRLPTRPSLTLCDVSTGLNSCLSLSLCKPQPQSPSLKASLTVGGNVSWSSHYGERHGGPSKN